MKILASLTRIYLAPGALEAAVAFYAELYDTAAGPRFAMPALGLSVARVGPVLLVAGEDEALASFRSTTLTLAVDSLAGAERWLADHGATIVRPRTEVPTGWSLHARHPDGAVAEYVELRAPPR